MRLALLAGFLAAAAVGFATENPPFAIQRPKPVYPARLKEQRVIGRAVVAVQVAADGSIEDVKNVAQSAPEFGVAAAEAVRAWKFKPGERDGRPVAMMVNVPFEFFFSAEEIKAWESARPPIAWPPGPPLMEAALLSELPELKGNGRPKIPKDMPKWLIENAVIRFVVDEEGRTRDAHLVMTTHAACGTLALEAVGEWKFRPGKSEGRVVRTAMEVTVSFFPGDRDSSGPRLRPGVSRNFVTEVNGQPVVPFTGAPGEEPPRPVKRFDLDYPREMDNERLPGFVLVECIINPHGVVTHVRALNTQNQFFAIAAERAFSRWRFSPPRKDGKPVFYRGTMTANFIVKS